jgi:hypothetical protein
MQEKLQRRRVDADSCRFGVSRADALEFWRKGLWTGALEVHGSRSCHTEDLLPVKPSVACPRSHHLSTLPSSKHALCYPSAIHLPSAISTAFARHPALHSL